MNYALISIPGKDKLFYKTLFKKLGLKSAFLNDNWQKELIRARLRSSKAKNYLPWNEAKKKLKKRAKDLESGKVAGRSRAEVRKAVT